jgi:hypothetical protein
MPNVPRTVAEEWIEFCEILGHEATTYRQIAGIALHRPVVQIPVFGLCLTI